MLLSFVILNKYDQIEKYLYAYACKWHSGSYIIAFVFSSVLPEDSHFEGLPKVESKKHSLVVST